MMGFGLAVKEAAHSDIEVISVEKFSNRSARVERMVSIGGEESTVGTRHVLIDFLLTDLPRPVYADAKVGSSAYICRSAGQLMTWLEDVVTLSWIPRCSPEPRVVFDSLARAVTAETSGYPPGRRHGCCRADRHERETDATALPGRQAAAEHERKPGREHGSGSDHETQLRQRQSDHTHAFKQAINGPVVREPPDARRPDLGRSTHRVAVPCRAC